MEGSKSSRMDAKQGKFPADTPQVQQGRSGPFCDGAKQPSSMDCLKDEVSTSHRGRHSKLQLAISAIVRLSSHAVNSKGDPESPVFLVAK